MDINNILDQWLTAYNELEQLYDKRWDRLNKYTDKGETKKAAAVSQKMDEIDAEMKGMRKVLSILGYVVIYQDGKNVVVTQ